MIEKHELQIQKTARYFTIKPDEVKSVLIAIHGYRQLASNFIKRFEPLGGDGVLVVAPEGLHRFYVEGHSGKIGASWMTKEDREMDIHDYVGYLNDLAEHLELPEVPIHLLGFSQGGPTACRWLAQSDIQFESLILHSSVFPNDFDFDAQRDKLASVRSVSIFGDDDFFATEEIIEKKMKWMKSHGFVPELLRFKGGHHIHLDSVRMVLKKN